jgi:hypothetical protein
MANFNLDNYVPVNERLEKFYKDFPTGRVVTEMIQHDMDTGFVLFRAAVYRGLEDAEPSATGHAFERQGEGYVNKTSYIENCETSSVGRALALLGYEITKGIASREEMAKVQRQSTPQQQPAQRPQPSASGSTGNKLSEGQAKAIFAICKSKNIEEKSFLSAHGCQSKSDLTMKEASELIEILNGLEKSV